MSGEPFLLAGKVQVHIERRAGRPDRFEGAALDTGDGPASQDATTSERIRPSFAAVRPPYGVTEKIKPWGLLAVKPTVP